MEVNELQESKREKLQMQNYAKIDADKQMMRASREVNVKQDSKIKGEMLERKRIKKAGRGLQEKSRLVRKRIMNAKMKRQVPVFNVFTPIENEDRLESSEEEKSTDKEQQEEEEMLSEKEIIEQVQELEEDEDEELLSPWDILEEKEKDKERQERGAYKRSTRYLTPYQKPTKPWPENLSEIQRKEAIYFHRKMRAFRNLKNHLLTANLEELEEEAKRKRWGDLPEFITDNRPRHNQVHVEVMYHYWPQPFEEVEKLWLTRHFKEFARQWEVPDEEVMSSKILTPYMKFIRCYPHSALLQIKQVIPPSNKPSRRQLDIPITGVNIIIDAKAVLTYYGMHRLKDWEVHDNVDYEVMDYQILLEEVQEASRIMVKRLKDAKQEIRKYKEEERARALFERL